MPSRHHHLPPRWQAPNIRKTRHCVASCLKPNASAAARCWFAGGSSMAPGQAEAAWFRRPQNRSPTPSIAAAGGHQRQHDDLVVAPDHREDWRVLEEIAADREAELVAVILRGADHVGDEEE